MEIRDDGAFKCPCCTRVFDSERGMRSHEGRMHKGIVDVAEDHVLAPPPHEDNALSAAGRVELVNAELVQENDESGDFPAPLFPAVGDLPAGLDDLDPDLPVAGVAEVNLLDLADNELHYPLAPALVEGDDVLVHEGRPPHCPSDDISSLLVDIDHEDVSVEVLEKRIQMALASVGLETEEELDFLHLHATEGLSLRASQAYRNHFVKHSDVDMKKDLRNIQRKAARIIATRLVGDEEEAFATSGFRSSKRLVKTVVTFPNERYQKLLGVEDATKLYTVLQRDPAELLQEIWKDTLRLASLRGGRMEYEDAPKSDTCFRESSYAYKGYHTGMRYFVDREVRRRIHEMPTLELFGLIFFIDGTQVTTFNGKKVIPIFCSTTLQSIEERQIYLLGYIPVLTKKIDKDDDKSGAWFYWRNQILNAILQKFDWFNQHVGTFTVSKDDGTSTPLVVNFAFLISDYPEGCDQCRFKSTAMGIRPCRLCIVPRSFLTQGTRHWGLRSNVGRESLYKGADIPVDLKEYMRRYPAGGGHNNAESSVDPERVSAEKLQEFMNFVNLHTVKQLRSLCNYKSIKNVSALTLKSQLVSALRDQWIASNREEGGDDESKDNEEEDSLPLPPDLEHVAGFYKCTETGPPAFACYAATIYNSIFNHPEKVKVLRMSLVTDKAPPDPMHTLNGLIKHLLEEFCNLVKMEKAYASSWDAALAEINVLLHADELVELANSRGERLRQFDGSLGSLAGYTHMEVLHLFTRFVFTICFESNARRFLSHASAVVLQDLAVALYRVTVLCGSNSGKHGWTEKLIFWLEEECLRVNRLFRSLFSSINNCNWPKLHNLVHLAAFIREFGLPREFDSPRYECMHKGPKQLFRRTNGHVRGRDGYPIENVLLTKQMVREVLSETRIIVHALAEAREAKSTEESTSRDSSLTKRNPDSIYLHGRSITVSRDPDDTESFVFPTDASRMTMLPLPSLISIISVMTRHLGEDRECLCWHLYFKCDITPGAIIPGITRRIYASPGGRHTSLSFKDPSSSAVTIGKPIFFAVPQLKNQPLMKYSKLAGAGDILAVFSPFVSTGSSSVEQPPPFPAGPSCHSVSFPFQSFTLDRSRISISPMARFLSFGNMVPVDSFHAVYVQCIMP